MQKISTLSIKKSKLGLYCSIVGLAAASMALSSCQKTGDKGSAHPTYIASEFVPTSSGYVGSYFLKSTNDPYSIPVGFTVASDVDRVINFTYTSKTAVAGTHYTAPASVTIKAGTYLDTLRFKGVFANYPTGRKDSVTIKMNSGYPALDGQGSFVVITQPYCNVVSTALSGNYSNSHDYYPSVISAGNDQGGYVANISAWTPISGSSTKATVIMKNIGGSYFGPFISTDAAISTGITATLDWTDAANFTLAIASQAYCNLGATYGNATVTGTGTWSSCDRAFTMKLTAKVAAGSFTPPLTVLK